MSDYTFSEEHNKFLRDKALIVLEKVKKLEKLKIEQGYRYVTTDVITRKLRKNEEEKN